MKRPIVQSKKKPSGFTLVVLLVAIIQFMSNPLSAKREVVIEVEEVEDVDGETDHDHEQADMVHLK